MITEDKKNNAIDALIRNIGDYGVTVEHFMTLLDINRPKAEELMMELHGQGKLEVKWVAGDYYNKQD